jgi:hypothetical protein
VKLALSALPALFMAKSVALVRLRDPAKPLHSTHRRPPAPNDCDRVARTCCVLQMVFGMVVAVSAGAMLLKLQPYVEPSDDTVSTVGMWVLFSTYLAGLLLRVQGLLPKGDIIAGKDQRFDVDALVGFVVAGAWIVPALAVAGVFIDTCFNVWQKAKVLHEGTPVAELLEKAPLWRRPLLVFGVGIPASCGGGTGTTAQPGGAGGGSAPSTGSSSSMGSVAATTPGLPPSQAPLSMQAQALRAFRRASRVRLLGSSAAAGRGLSGAAGGPSPPPPPPTSLPSPTSNGSPLVQAAARPLHSPLGVGGKTAQRWVAQPHVPWPLSPPPSPPTAPASSPVASTTNPLFSRVAVRADTILGATPPP